MLLFALSIFFYLPPGLIFPLSTFSFPSSSSCFKYHPCGLFTFISPSPSSPLLNLIIVSRDYIFPFAPSPTSFKSLCPHILSYTYTFHPLTFVFVHSTPVLSSSSSASNTHVKNVITLWNPVKFEKKKNGKIGNVDHG